MFQEDTICAISTPQGMGGIAVVRVSGTEAIGIVSKRWQGADLGTIKSHTAHLGSIVDSHGELLDQVVLTLFRGPHSFTGEDVIEIACHGSLWIQQQLVATLIDAGCRAATGGEFTRRAFVNGRMDLSQAEAVADLIASGSKASHRVAMNQMRGNFSRRLDQLRDQLLQFVSLIELELDFSEEDVTFADRSNLVNLATEIHDTISRLADSFQAGNAIKNGIPVAIVGQTNAGKSTLLNQLLQDDRALVSDVQGTTRDVIEDTITLGGTLFRFIDTAGLRQATDTIEAMGIERAYQKLEQSSIVLWVVDATTPVQQVLDFSQHVLSHATGKHIIAVVNKTDVADEAQLSALSQSLAEVLPQGSHVEQISAKQGNGLEHLTATLLQAAALPAIADDSVIVTNARHYDALVRARGAIERVLQGLADGLSGDLVSQDIRECMHYLAEITGQITTDDLLGNIFAHFCIGK